MRRESRRPSHTSRLQRGRGMSSRRRLYRRRQPNAPPREIGPQPGRNSSCHRLSFCKEERMFTRSTHNAKDKEQSPAHGMLVNTSTGTPQGPPQMSSTRPDIYFMRTSRRSSRRNLNLSCGDTWPSSDDGRQPPRPTQPRRACYSHPRSPPKIQSRAVVFLAANFRGRHYHQEGACGDSLNTFGRQGIQVFDHGGLFLSLFLDTGVTDEVEHDPQPLNNFYIFFRRAVGGRRVEEFALRHFFSVDAHVEFEVRSPDEA